MVLGVVIYAKISSAAASTVVVKEAPEAIACQPEFEEMDLDVQYDPKKEIEGANFGGI